MSKLIRQGEANLVSFGQLGSKLIVDNAGAGGGASDTGKIVVAIQSLSDESLITSTPDSGEPAGCMGDDCGPSRAAAASL